jgi:uncharacterized membrane protein YhaH (DUF805 family)
VSAYLALVTSRRAFWALAIPAACLGFADAVFASVTAVIWPAAAAMPSWQPRVFSAIWTLALILTAAAGLNLAWRRWRQP